MTGASRDDLAVATRLPPIDVRRWVNSAPLTPEELRGRVVLVDVWEYTCVNWIRTARTCGRGTATTGIWGSR
ncbi:MULTISPECIES: hypothetical protein [Micromonospora]|uniref:hypothetical protein n=1 Tax=Micromonospora TaxID=1873 RepID=UPI001FFCDA3C|nr:hypothetical protein [Micromonospora sp. C41]